MQPVSITKAFVVGLLAFAPLTVGFSAEVGVNDVQRRHVGSLSGLASMMARAVIPRHHTEAQIAAKEAAKGKKTQKREAQAPDEFGPWDSTEDEFGSWVDKREAHHTEAQIAAKAAAKGKKTQKREAQAPDEFGPWDSTEDEFGSWVDKREAHHTEAQIAAKAAAAAKKHQARHHTEAQIAAKEAAKAKKGGN